jgi:hypothetical protein
VTLLYWPLGDPLALSLREDLTYYANLTDVVEGTICARMTTQRDVVNYRSSYGLECVHDQCVRVEGYGTG